MALAFTRVPTTSDFTRYVQLTEMGERRYRIRLAWQGRSAAWYFSLYAEDGTPLVLGRKLRLAYPVLRQFVATGKLPEGHLLIPDLDRSKVEPGREDLGERLQVLYGE